MFISISCVLVDHAMWCGERRCQRCGDRGNRSRGGMRHGGQLHPRAELLPSERGVKCSGLKVVRDFLQKVALELGTEEWWKFWGIELQPGAQFNPPHSHTECWPRIFCFQGPAVFFMFITRQYLLALNKNKSYLQWAQTC